MNFVLIFCRLFIDEVVLVQSEDAPVWAASVTACFYRKYVNIEKNFSLFFCKNVMYSVGLIQF